MRGDPPYNQFQHGRAGAIMLCTEFDVKAQHCMAELAKASRQASAATKDLDNNLISIGNGTLSGMTERTLQPCKTRFVRQPLRDDLLVGHGVQFAFESADLTNSIGRLRGLWNTCAMFCST